MALRNPTRGRELLQHQLNRIAWLRGTGPDPFQYNRWDDRTRELIEAIFGSDSAELASYQFEVGRTGRYAGVRGDAENMTLNQYGQWGILGRLERAERLLASFLGGMDAPGEPMPGAPQ
jgi:hypothetical protein